MNKTDLSSVLTLETDTIVSGLGIVRKINYNIFKKEQTCIH